MDKEFKISELFTIKKVYGKPIDKYPKGSVPYVTGSNSNNGVIGYVSPDKQAISAGNCISVDPIKGYACYQPVDFVGRGFSGASINLLYTENLDERNALFICAAIEKIAKPISSYSKLFNSERLANAKITIPVKQKYVPDWGLIAHSNFGGVLIW